MAMQLAAGRTVFAGIIMAAPVVSVRFLGADGATSRRISWLSRMTAARDGALGVCGLLAARQSGSAAAPWIIAGAVCDAVDSVVIAGALKDGRVKGIGPAASVPLAAGAAVLGAITAARLRSAS
jgi:hypothetical protein